MGVEKTELEGLCQALLQADPDIQEIVQFGSSVYAPDLALDIDLVVTTAMKKDRDIYWDAVADWPINVDVVVREPGEPIGDRIARGICAAHQVLYGNGQTLKEAMTTMPVPTYEEAYAALQAAHEYHRSAVAASDELLRDRHHRTAFNALFDAARSAAMTYLSTEETRWGELRRALPAPHAKAFREFVNVLHVEYFYHGNYPREDVEGVFHRWHKQVGRFIEALKRESSGPSPGG